MNTVNALKDLYKTLCGKDYAGDPNPTDAEMISAIAKDASSGGGSENKAYFPLSIEIGGQFPRITTPFADILAATQKGIPCAVVSDNGNFDYWGLGEIHIGDPGADSSIVFSNYFVSYTGEVRFNRYTVFASNGNVVIDTVRVVGTVGT